MHSINFNLVNDLYLSYYYLIKATQLQFDWYYLECAIIIKNVISGDFGFCKWTLHSDILVFQCVLINDGVCPQTYAKVY